MLKMLYHDCVWNIVEQIYSMVILQLWKNNTTCSLILFELHGFECHLLKYKENLRFLKKLCLVTYISKFNP